MYESIVARRGNLEDVLEDRAGQILKLYNISQKCDSILSVKGKTADFSEGM